MFVDEMKDRHMVTQAEVNALQREVAELTKRLERAETAIERLQERPATVEVRPVAFGMQPNPALFGCAAPGLMNTDAFVIGPDGLISKRT